MPVDMSRVVWWLIWGYSQIVFFLLVAGIASGFHGGSNDFSEMTGKSSVGKSAPSKVGESGEKGEKRAKGDAGSSQGHPSFLVLEAPALFAMLAILVLLTRPAAPMPADAVPKPPVRRWSNAKWWIGSFLLSWLLGLSISVLFVGSSIMLVVAFLAVLGLGAGIAVVLSRSAAAPRSDVAGPPDRIEANP